MSDPSMETDEADSLEFDEKVAFAWSDLQIANPSDSPRKSNTVIANISSNNNSGFTNKKKIYEKARKELSGENLLQRFEKEENNGSGLNKHYNNFLYNKKEIVGNCEEEKGSDANDKTDKISSQKAKEIDYVNIKTNNASNPITANILLSKNSRISSKEELGKHDKNIELHIHKVHDNTHLNNNKSTDDEEEKYDFEVNEHIAYSSNYKTNRKYDTKLTSTSKNNGTKSHEGKYKLNKEQSTSKNMVKKIPKFFKESTKETVLENNKIESAYTEMARKLLLAQLEGKNSKSEVYSMMTNEFKLKSIIEKKNTNKKKQKRRTKYLYKAKIGNSTCDRDKRLSHGITDLKFKDKYLEPCNKNQISRQTNYQEKDYQVNRIENDENWRTQTYQKLSGITGEFEPIIERPQDEAYGTASYKRSQK